MSRFASLASYPTCDSCLRGPPKRSCFSEIPPLAHSVSLQDLTEPSRLSSAAAAKRSAVGLNRQASAA